MNLNFKEMYLMTGFVLRGHTLILFQAFVVLMTKDRPIYRFTNIFPDI